MSTHSGEEEFVINTIKNLKKEKISSQCILIPRHINRIDKITYLIKANNLTYQLKSTDPIPLEDKDIYILNSYGDTKEVFEKINLVFLGGLYYCTWRSKST
jgi:3-deoxy-D-manno-octulosonic-acid transferase